jgi:hypothetical protein
MSETVIVADTEAIIALVDAEPWACNVHVRRILRLLARWAV